MCYAPYCHSRWQSIVVVLYRREFITPDSRALEEATNQQLARPAAGRRHRYLLWLPAARGSSLDPFPIEPSVTTPRQTGINQEKNQSITRTYAQAHAGTSARVSVATPRFLSHYSCRAAPRRSPLPQRLGPRGGKAAPARWRCSVAAGHPRGRLRNTVDLFRTGRALPRPRRALPARGITLPFSFASASGSVRSFLCIHRTASGRLGGPYQYHTGPQPGRI